MRYTLVALCLVFFRHLVVISSSDLSDMLSKSRFLHEGVTRSTDSFNFLPIQCMYLEGENISCTQCSWATQCLYKYLANNDVPNSGCNASQPQNGYDRLGGDKNTIVLNRNDWSLCQAACCQDQYCYGWVYVPSAPGNFMSCRQGDHCCYIKATDVAPSKSPLPGIVSGAVDRPMSKGNPPELGIRSAVPLGGLGAGALELRGDGTFHEVTIQNQHPASSGKYGVLADAMLGFHVMSEEGGGPQFRALRTNPPSFADGVSQISYSGSYPLSRLRVMDDSVGLPVTFYAYHKFKPSDVKASAIPAVVFTMTVQNTGSNTAQASMFFNLPFGAINDCVRVSKNFITSTPANSPAACVSSCAQNPRCASWNFDPTNNTCFINGDVPHSQYMSNWYCGVAGYWTGNSNALTFHGTPQSDALSSSAGNVTLAAVGSDGAKISFAVGDSVGDLYNQFVAGNGVFGAPVSSKPAASGAAAVSVGVPPGQTATMSIIFSWYFPERDHMGVNVGNYYSLLGVSSEDFALRFTDEKVLTSIVSDINNHHSIYSNDLTSYPNWLQDHMLNQFSHFRGMMYLRDGRMREYEAPDCPDIDSIHNDYQRHLPYIWAFPEFEYSKAAKWAEGQNPDGHLWEDLGSFSLGPLDRWADRTMGDTTSLWIMEQYEFYINTNNLDYLKKYYGQIVAAIKWMVSNANTNNQGLPYRLPCTYDIIAFDQYSTTTFNSMLYLASLKACQNMATTLGDSSTLTFCKNAFNTGQSQLYKLLWNETIGYFRAYTGGEALMGDCLYGQMVAHHHGLGWLVDPAKIVSHLQAELKYNGDPYGIKVVTGRNTPPPQTFSYLKQKSPSGRVRQGLAKIEEIHARYGYDTVDDVIWLGGAPDWSYLQIAVNSAVDVTSALSPTELQLNNYRDRLRDLWNIVGIITPSDWGNTPNDMLQGMPFVTSHYGFVMTDYYLLPVLSGQQTNLPGGSLTFAPRYSCPFNLPLLVQNVTGTISCSNNQYTATVYFGQLSLPQNGLVINGRPYPNAVSLSEGQSVTW